MGKFRQHSIEEKRKRSKLRKKRKRERARKALEENMQQLSGEEQEPDRAQQPESSNAAPSASREDVVEGSVRQASTAALCARQKSDGGDSEKTPDRVEELKKSRDAKHRHAVVFYNNWMKSEKANIQLIHMKDIKITQRNIGKGSYGVCHVGFYGATCVAVKKIERWSEFKMEEAMILRKLRHPNIQMFIGLAWQGDDAHVVSRFHGIQGRSFTLSKAAELDMLNEENWRLTATQVCSAVKYLHVDAEIIHNDIKPNNIVVEQGRSAAELIPVLIDFGKACFMHEARVIAEERDPAKFPFLAPELNQGQRQSASSDIFSLGYTLRRVSHAINDSSLKLIYRSCLSADPLERPGITTILGQFK